MNRSIRPLIGGLVLVLPAIGLTGCGAPQKAQGPAASTAVFYPPAPAPPRLQFLTSFSNAETWAKKQSGNTSLSEWIVGDKKDPQDQSGKIKSPYGIAARDGKLYICDVERDCVHVIDLVNKRYNLLGSPDLFKNPVNITIGPDGTRYVCDTKRRLIVVFDANDQYVRELGDPERGAPCDVAVGADALYVTDIRDCEIEVWSMQGELVRTISKKGPGPDEFSDPTNLALGPDGYLYITDTLQQIVKVFDTEGNYRGSIGSPGSDIGFFARPKGIAVDRAGTVYVADAQWDVVQMFNTQGNLLLVFGEPGREAYSMGLPACVDIDATSMQAFQQFIDPNFDAQYLLFLTNQFGKNKVAVYAFGRARHLTPQQYELDKEEIERARARIRERAAEEEAQKQSPRADDPATNP